MAVTLACRAAAAAPWRAYVRTRAAQVLDALGLERYELSLVLVGDAEMRRLNGIHRGRDRATDVLAFPLHTHPRSERDLARGVERERCVAHLLLGDVVISIDTAAAQAGGTGRALAGRLDALVVHGVLHLVGYDHEVSAVEARRMARRARALHAVLPSRPPPPRASSRRRGRTARRTPRART